MTFPNTCHHDQCRSLPEACASEIHIMDMLSFILSRYIYAMPIDRVILHWQAAILPTQDPLESKLHPFVWHSELYILAVSSIMMLCVGRINTASFSPDISKDCDCAGIQSRGSDNAIQKPEAPAMPNPQGGQGVHARRSVPFCTWRA